MEYEHEPWYRRTVLKTLGAGIAGSAVLAGPVSAKKDNYGNGNGIGAFLNEEALFKDQPIWDSGIANETGQSAVEILVGALTSIDVPIPNAPDQGPFAFDPHAVKVSPGTEVTWTWVAEHHSVTSFNEDADDPADPTTTGDHGQVFDEHGNAPHSFTHTFDDPGTYLYFCHPHGTPYPAFDPFLNDTVENLFGMRGAVLVRGR